jgi:hypothetical protein
MDEIIDSLEWKCPDCGFINGLLITEDGPVSEDICGGCDLVLFIADIRRLYQIDTPATVAHEC